MAETAQFLDYCHAHDPQSADLVELLIGTGIRKGEALALHWADVNLDEGVLRVRWTLSAVDNNRLVLTAPKTRASRNWVALSGRVTQALERRAAAGESPDGLVFHRADGRPLHPEYTLNHFHLLCARGWGPRDHAARPAAPGRDDLHHGRRATGGRLQDPAPLHAFDNSQHLQPSDQPGRRPDQPQPRPRRTTHAPTPGGRDHFATTSTARRASTP